MPWENSFLGLFWFFRVPLTIHFGGLDLYFYHFLWERRLDVERPHETTCHYLSRQSQLILRIHVCLSILLSTCLSICRAYTYGVGEVNWPFPSIILNLPFFGYFWYAILENKTCFLHISYKQSPTKHWFAKISNFAQKWDKMVKIIFTDSKCVKCEITPFDILFSWLIH